MREIKLPKHGGPNSFKEAWVGLRNRKATVNKRNLQIGDLKKRNAEMLAKLQELEREKADFSASVHFKELKGKVFITKVERLK